MSHHQLPLQRQTHTHFSIALCLCSSFGRCMSVCATCVGAGLEASASLFLALLPSLPLLLCPLSLSAVFPWSALTLHSPPTQLTLSSTIHLCTLSVYPFYLFPFLPATSSLSFSCSRFSDADWLFFNSLKSCLFNMINIIASVVHVHGMMNF